MAWAKRPSGSGHHFGRLTSDRAPGAFRLRRQEGWLTNYVSYNPNGTCKQYANRYDVSQGICQQVSPSCQTWDNFIGNCTTGYSKFNLIGGSAWSAPREPPVRRLDWLQLFKHGLEVESSSSQVYTAQGTTGDPLVFCSWEPHLHGPKFGKRNDHQDYCQWSEHGHHYQLRVSPYVTSQSGGVQPDVPQRLQSELRLE